MDKKELMKVSIGGFLPQSFSDYPGEVCAQIYFCGCPFRCPFCHNYKIVTECDKNCGESEVDALLAPIEKEKWAIDAVSITGGEPTMQIEPLLEIAKKVKIMGLKFKIDTNGYYPENVKRILPFLDFIAMDFKGPFERYTKVAGANIPDLEGRVKESLELIKKAKIPKEIRLTVVPGLIDSAGDIRKMARELRGMTFVLQQFRGSEGTLDPSYSSVPSPSEEKLRELAKVAKKEGVKELKIRIAGMPDISI
jgi:pyruvate formate lyase activating enzyme